MAAPTDFNVGSGIKATRKLLMHFIDVGSTNTPEWERLGRGVEDSAVETNAASSTVTDITGITETNVEKFEQSQTFEPNTVRGGSKANFKIHEILRLNQPELLSNFKILTVYAYITADSTSSSTAYEADVQDGCTIIPTSIGGSAYVDMPIELHYSGNKTFGTATLTGGVPTFTANS